MYAFLLTVLQKTGLQFFWNWVKDYFELDDSNIWSLVKAASWLLGIFLVGLLLISGGLFVFAILAMLVLIVLSALGKTNKLARYCKNVWYSIDQTINTILGGNPDHTLSGRIGYHALQGSKTCLYMEKVVNLLFWFDKDHCRSAIEYDEQPENENGFKTKR